MRRQKLIDKTNARLMEAAEELHSYGLWATTEGYPAMAEQMFRGWATLLWLADHTADVGYRNEAIALLNYLGPKPKKYIRQNPPQITTLAEKRARIATIRAAEKVLAPWTAWREYRQAPTPQQRGTAVS